MQPKPKNQDGRVDRVTMQAGIVHLPAEFREVARRASQAGLDGYRFEDLEFAFNRAKLAGLGESLETSWPECQIVITYGEPRSPAPVPRLDPRVVGAAPYQAGSRGGA